MTMVNSPTPISLAGTVTSGGLNESAELELNTGGQGYNSSGNATISMNDTVLRTLAQVGGSGTAWSMSSLYGKSAAKLTLVGESYSASTGGNPRIPLSGPVGFYIQLPGGVGNGSALIPSALAWTVWSYVDNSAAQGATIAAITSSDLYAMNTLPSAASNWSVRYTEISNTYTANITGNIGSTASAGIITENPASASGSWYNLGSSNYLFYAITGNANPVYGGVVNAQYTYQFQLDFALTSNTNNIIATAQFTATNNYTATRVPYKSDIRLKRDITLLDTLYNGIKIYKFRYSWSDVEYVGVMAQDLLDSEYSSAVIKNSDGYYSVDYSQLGFNMTTYDDYLKSTKSNVVRELV